MFPEEKKNNLRGIPCLFETSHGLKSEGKHFSDFHSWASP